MTYEALQQERARLSTNLEQAEYAISALNGAGGMTRSLSPAVRARIAATQRARWAKVKKQRAVSITGRSLSRKPRKLSVAAIAETIIVRLRNYAGLNGGGYKRASSRADSYDTLAPTWASPMISAFHDK